LTEAKKLIATMEKDLIAKEKQRNKLFGLYPKAMEDKIKLALKEKPKRTGNKEGGFNKISPIPPKLIKYLGLEKDAQLPRPQVVKQLNQKFKDGGMKDGQVTTLNKEAADALGKEEGRKIELYGFQTFLKEFYDEAFPTKNIVTMD
jgi:hypothetical protein